MPSSTAVGLLLFRVFFGLVIASHGLVKLGDFSGFAARSGGTLLALCAVAGELGGGLGLATGLLTRVAGAGVAAVMFFIAFTVQLANASALGTGKGTAFEYPFLLGMFGVAFVVMGAGPYSLDAVIQRRLKRSAPAARV
ncbi:MAG TPA: DoxX family membrane protein [Myxococcaceae bacterium]|nr:DoxX family membrane protein [Myxococcaceae bacterium]